MADKRGEASRHSKMERRAKSGLLGSVLLTSRFFPDCGCDKTKSKSKGAWTRQIRWPSGIVEVGCDCLLPSWLLETVLLQSINNTPSPAFLRCCWYCCCWPHTCRREGPNLGGGYRGWCWCWCCSRFPTPCDLGEAGKMSGQAWDIGLRCDQRGWRNDEQVLFQGRERGTAISKVLLKDRGMGWNSNVQPVGDHSQCADGRETRRRADGAAKHTRRWDGDCCLLGGFHAFSRSMDALCMGPLVVPDVSVVPGPTHPPAGLARHCQGPRGGARGGFATCSGARSSPTGPPAASHCSPETT